MAYPAGRVVRAGPPAARPEHDVDERADRTRRSYDEVAEPFLESTRDRSVVARWLDAFAGRLGSGAPVLDLGAGPGADSAALGRLGLRPVCLDLSLGMLRAGAAEFPGPRVQGDARRLPLRSGCVHGVWANASLLHLPPDEAAQALRESGRVLWSRGLLHVSVKSGEGSEWESRRYGAPRWFQYWSAADLDALLADTDFEVVDSWANSTPRADWLVRHALLRRNRG